MKQKIISVFVIEAGKYVEITYQEFVNRYTSDESYKSKYFIYVSKRLLEVSQDDYIKHYREIERNKYLKKLDIEHGLISMDDMDNGQTVGCETSEDIAASVDRDCLKRKLFDCLSILTEDERELIDAIFFYGMTEREYAAQKGVYHNAIHKKKIRILKKLKKLMEN